MKNLIMLADSGAIIALGKKFGVTAVLVPSGETKAKDVDKATPQDKPDFVFESLAEVDKKIFG